jgi:hypothetical protein
MKPENLYIPETPRPWRRLGEITPTHSGFAAEDGLVYPTSRVFLVDLVGNEEDLEELAAIYGLLEVEKTRHVEELTRLEKRWREKLRTFSRPGVQR